LLCQTRRLLNAMAEEAMEEEAIAEEPIAEEVTAEEIMARALATSGATAATEGATRVDTGMAVIPSTTVIKDMAVIGPMVGMSVIPAIMGTVGITVTTTTTTTTAYGLALAPAF
jgi:hypothetical protein